MMSEADLCQPADSDVNPSPPAGHGQIIAPRTGVGIRLCRESHDHAPPDPSGALWTVPVPFNVVSGRR